MKTFEQIRNIEISEAPIDPQKVVNQAYKEYREILKIIREAEADIRKKLDSIQGQLISASAYLEPGSSSDSLDLMPYKAITAMKEVVKNQRTYEENYLTTMLDNIKR